MIKFLHSSDLHLAKPFGRFDEDLRARLREARFEKIAGLAGAARAAGARFVLLAGDTFDAETPTPLVVRHALRAFAAENDITWVILPGNHDSLAATDLWDRMVQQAPENVVLALTAQPIALGDHILLLPAPPTARNPGRDLTEWMDNAEVPQGWSDRVRIGLAHGSIQGFGEDGENGIIAPDRPGRAGLDYLALGDWHGRLRVGSRCWYSGTPEADNFRHDDKAGALLVQIEKRGAEPLVEVLPTSRFSWRDIALDFRPGEDITARLASVFPASDARRATLISLSIIGRLGISERAELAGQLSRMADDFSFFETELANLAIEQEAGALDHIDTGGALRAAAESIAAASMDNARSEAERKVSSAALARLYDYAMEQKT